MPNLNERRIHLSRNCQSKTSGIAVESGEKKLKRFYPLRRRMSYPPCYAKTKKIRNYELQSPRKPNTNSSTPSAPCLEPASWSAVVLRCFGLILDPNDH